ncbi:MAG TPA: 2OG-Fe(II) oxygenase [Alphaproteobacteria bacterium]|nr:2OG-Fe(II) oxygenase [Alphaproteobacteria bacterium]
MDEPSTTIAHRFLDCLGESRVIAHPFRHWLLRDALPEEVALDITRLPIGLPEIRDTQGRRETHNDMRVFFSPERRHRFAVCRELALAFQATDTVCAIESLCGVQLGGSFLRIEYCQDTDGFWLEPHTDIDVKLFTMLIYVSTDAAAESWGTDIYDASMNWMGSAPGSFNRGLIFIPGANTWHGFRRRQLSGIRRSLIINYVTTEWRARHELAFPNSPIS